MRPLPATMRDQEVFEPLGPPIRALEPLTQAEGKVFEDAMFEGSDWDAMAPNAVYDRRHGWVHADLIDRKVVTATAHSVKRRAVVWKTQDAKPLGENANAGVIHIGDAAFEAAFPFMATNEGDNLRTVFNRAQASALNHLIAKEGAHLLASTNTGGTHVGDDLIRFYEH